MQEFDLTNSPLDRNNLIEAGAGTGKTFTISGIYLRLLLEKGLRVEDILVVTFTITATEELRDRIRNRLSTALQYFQNFDSLETEDNLLCKLGESIDPVQATPLLRTALQNFDQARIFTIHGFCQRLLTDHAFECSHPFEQEFLTDQSGIIRELVRDFWRTRIQDQSALFASYARQNKLTEEELIKLSLNWIKHPKINILPAPQSIRTEELQEHFQSCFERAKQCWQQERDAILGKLVDNPNVKRNKDYSKHARKLDWYFMPYTASTEYEECLKKFSSANLVPENLVKKHCTPPEHEFFHLCHELLETADKLRDLFEQKTISLQSELLQFIALELPKRKEKLGVISFDDLLSRTYSALSKSGHNPLLQTARQNYQAGLIDEFQDTDPVQCRIFTTIFGDKRPLFLIGDPKQAIYGFRGADVYAYLEAKQGIDRQYTLKTNWRSEEGLLKAINRIFASERPFVFEQIEYQQLQAPDLEQDKIIIQGEPSAGTVIWNTDNCPEKSRTKNLAKGTAEEHLAAATAREISRILHLSDQEAAYFRTKTGSHQISPEHFAVLVRTHKQAYLVQRELKKAGVPGVMAKSGNIFDSEEAREIKYILSALENPAHTPSICSALSTTLLGFSAQDIYHLTQYQEQFVHWVGEMHRYQGIWQEKGIMSALTRLIREQEIRSRVLAQEGGQRRVTNLGHLVEILHRQEREEHLSSRELLLWLDKKMQSRPGNDEEYELRLETDEKAVSLITIHRSKGLQFPIVFAPFVFSGSRIELPALFHDPENRDELSMDLGSRSSSHHLDLYSREQLAENLRLFYVALSRAKHLCYTAWGHLNINQTSAPFYLWHTDKNIPGQEQQECHKNLQFFSESGVQTALQRLSADCSHIAVRDMPVQEQTPWHWDFAQDLAGENLGIKRSLQTNRLLSSFTYLIRGSGEDAKGYDEIDSPSTESEFTAMSGFPRGIKSGNLLHSLMENADFEQTDPGAHAPQVRNTLHSYRFHPEWENTLCTMLSELLQTPLHTEQEIILSSLPANLRIHELEFYIPLSRVTPRALQEFYSQQTGQGINRRFADNLGRLVFAPHQGFLRGFIDLVFYHQGKYYLVDWKSNYLGPEPGDYASSTLQSVMLRDFYLLQSHLYAMALQRHLRQRIPDFDYAEHFGGLFYIFLRGVDKNVPGQGIFFQQPGRDFLNNLEQFLLPV